MTPELNTILKALCLSFIHSLWQGFVLFIGLGILLWVTKKFSSSLRYNLLCFGILIFTGVFLYTLISCYLLLIITPTTDHLKDISGAGIEVVLGKGNNIFQQVTEWCLNHCAILLGIWLLIFIIKTSMMMQSLFEIRRLKTTGVTEINSQWLDRVKILSEKLQVRFAILVYETISVTQPMVIGWLKPTILLPVGFFNRLTIEEAEAILLHELAHIKRKDFLVNLVQAILETIFFFNPFLLWLSSRIRKEREFCCDQLAANKSTDKTTLIKALLSFSDSHPHDLKFAMKFGRSYPLTERAERLLQTSSALPGKHILLIMLIGVMSIFLLLSNFRNDKNNYTSYTSSFKGTKAGSKNNSNTKKKSKIYEAEYLMKVQNKKQVADTIPSGASKEFIDGYNAAINYNRRTQTADEKFNIESIQKMSNHINKNPVPVDENVYAQKRRIELNLQKRSKD